MSISGLGQSDHQDTHIKEFINKETRHLSEDKLYTDLTFVAVCSFQGLVKNDHQYIQSKEFIKSFFSGLLGMMDKDSSQVLGAGIVP